MHERERGHERTTADAPAGGRRAVALVTGATGGIGEATCRALAEAGFAVAAAARDLARAEELAAALARSGAEAIAVALDVASEHGAREAVRSATARLGPITCLVNNAGIAESCKVDDDGARARLERMLLVNFHGALRCFDACLPSFREAGSGRVVQIASSAALQGYAYASGYAASKHALLGWTRSAALELRRESIGFTAICPHYVDSPMTGDSARRIAEKTGRSVEEAYASLAAMNPGARLVTCDEVAAAVREAALSLQSGVVVELDGAGSRTVEEGFLLEARSGSEARGRAR